MRWPSCRSPRNWLGGSLYPVDSWSQDWPTVPPRWTKRPRIEASLTVSATTIRSGRQVSSPCTIGVGGETTSGCTRRRRIWSYTAMTTASICHPLVRTGTLARSIPMPTGPTPGPWPPRVLDRRELDRLSAALRAIDKQHLCAILGDVPLTWPVTTRELEALGSFLECRAPLVAHRLDLMKEAM